MKIEKIENDKAIVSYIVTPETDKEKIIMSLLCVDYLQKELKKHEQTKKD